MGISPFSVGNRSTLQPHGPTRIQGSRYPALEYGNDATVGRPELGDFFGGDEDGGA